MPDQRKLLPDVKNGLQEGPETNNIENKDGKYQEKDDHSGKLTSTKRRKVSNEISSLRATDLETDGQWKDVSKFNPSEFKEIDSELVAHDTSQETLLNNRARFASLPQGGQIQPPLQYQTIMPTAHNINSTAQHLDSTRNSYQQQSQAKALLQAQPPWAVPVNNQMFNMIPANLALASVYPNLNKQAINAAAMNVQLMAMAGSLGINSQQQLMPGFQQAYQQAEQLNSIIVRGGTQASTLDLQLSVPSPPIAPIPQAPILDNASGNNRGPTLYLRTDDNCLSDYQILLRKQIEFFEASWQDVGRTASGRRRPIMMNQVGIQCRHCQNVPVKNRQKGAIYYPAKLTGIYQAAQNMGVMHIRKLCMHVDEDTINRLGTSEQTRGHGGKKYWADTASAQGVEEYLGGGLCFVTNPSVANK